jgi:hypothetical protein
MTSGAPIKEALIIIKSRDDDPKPIQNLHMYVQYILYSIVWRKGSVLDIILYTP